MVVEAPCASAPARGFEQELARGLDALSRVLDRLADRVVLFRWGGLVFVSFGLFAALGALVSTSGMAFLLVGQQMSPLLFGLLALAGSVAMVWPWTTACSSSARARCCAGRSSSPGAGCSASGS
jgi:hypothetical protein